MNQLATAIRRQCDGEKEIDLIQLSSVEKTALETVTSLIRLPAGDLAALLKAEPQPGEWAKSIPDPTT
ncbi:MAG: hypothetical protein PHQ40_11015 [Anaerolineaceae bacterium]|nr:hypothetical protein [Anaerolineaceae bacterium]